MKKYVVYRVFTKKERPKKDERMVYYGWSNSKVVIKAFLQQRDPKKYAVVKLKPEDIEMYSESIDDDDYLIDYIKIRSTSTDEEMCLFMTRNELMESEVFIQRMFVDQASLSNIDGNGPYLNMVIGLDDYYFEALYLIGYRPKEIDILFPSADYHDDISSDMTLDETIESAYTGDSYSNTNQQNEHSPMNIKGLGAFKEVSNKLYYSFESFIKALRDKM